MSFEKSNVINFGNQTRQILEIKNAIEKSNAANFGNEKKSNATNFGNEKKSNATNLKSK